jgi:integrase
LGVFLFIPDYFPPAITPIWASNPVTFSFSLDFLTLQAYFTPTSSRIIRLTPFLKEYLQMSQLLDQVRNQIRILHYSIRTEEAYINWIKQFIIFHNKRHPDELGAAEISRFLSYLASERNVAASTQNQALSALLFLYREVLDKPIDWIDDVERAKKARRLPVVFNKEEAKAVLRHLRGEMWLMASLLYG